MRDSRSDLCCSGLKFRAAEVGGEAARLRASMGERPWGSTRRIRGRGAACLESDWVRRVMDWLRCWRVFCGTNCEFTCKHAVDGVVDICRERGRLPCVSSFWERMAEMWNWRRGKIVLSMRTGLAVGLPLPRAEWTLNLCIA